MALVSPIPGAFGQVSTGVSLLLGIAGTTVTTIRDLPEAVLTKSAAGQWAAGFANGVFGERVDGSGEPLPAVMSVRVGQRRVKLTRASVAAAYPSASRRLVVFLHGLVETERSWLRSGWTAGTRSGGDFGSRLAKDLGCSPVYVRYNSGRHISDNGRELIDLLSGLVDAWPVAVTDIVLVGHSMGGLVARSALHQAHARAKGWSSKVTRLVCLGTPHTGAPLERVVARASALLGRGLLGVPLSWLLALRSDGIKDLAVGCLHEKQWMRQYADETLETVLPPTVRQLFISATLSRLDGSMLGRLVGDLLVGPASAADDSQRADVRWLGGLNHFDLLRHDRVYDAMLTWLRQNERVADPRS
ncbi:alpha/beta hydrolase [Actinocrispum sp. NPDC049592]|uniref:alpha/beta hydrolase n=1 Tax=Actinocrispum sp. NPDC049592 TaxID=3154835 RepID=UPI003426142A